MLYDALVPHLYGYILRKVNDESKAENLVHSTLLRMHEKRGEFRTGSCVTPWAVAIISRLFLDQVRKKKEVLALDDAGEAEPSSDSPGPVECIQAKELESLVRREVARLSPSQREAFELVCYAPMSYAEAAEVFEPQRGRRQAIRQFGRP